VSLLLAFFGISSLLGNSACFKTYPVLAGVLRLHLSASSLGGASAQIISAVLLLSLPKFMPLVFWLWLLRLLSILAGCVL
jgi:hypothetical protein